MKAHGHYFSSEIPWDSSARSHGHNTTILILNFNEKHKCSLWVWLAGTADTNKWSFPLWVRNNGGNYQDKETIILHQLSSVSLSVGGPSLSLSVCRQQSTWAQLWESFNIPVWHPVCFYSQWLNIVSLDFMLISGSLIQSHRVQLKELGSFRRITLIFVLNIWILCL